MNWITWAVTCAVLASALAAASGAPVRDTRPDTWVATDALGRTLPGYAQCGPPRDRTVAIFYFLWIGAHVNGGPHDITKILKADPEAIHHADSPLWGPMGAMHHWGRPLLDYYNADDPYVLRRHAQMLSDAGVDVAIFDCTNQATYKKQYMAMLKVWSEVRAAGGRTPQVAFLTPFWDPSRVVPELYRDLYGPGLYKDLWFLWDGKPLILADGSRLAGSGVQPTGEKRADRLEAGTTLGQSFTADKPFTSVAVSTPTWSSNSSGVTLRLLKEGPGGAPVRQQAFARVVDNGWVTLELLPAQPAGRYYVEMARPVGTVGWWSHAGDWLPGGQAFADAKPVAGDRLIEVGYLDDPSRSLHAFFTFRAPEPAYFVPPAHADMWSWLQVYPQHAYYNSRGEKEHMAVGVAQNAVNGRLGSMSEAGAYGRSRHNGATDTRPNAVRYGFNFAEQWERALKEDPKSVFVTGWNEWTAQRFGEFGGVREPVMFVDQFDQEHSRDIEPMTGGHGDDYYYQLAAYVRRFKGVRKPEAVGPSVAIDLRRGFGQWAAAKPEFLDDANDEAHRDHPGYNSFAQLRNTTGRNDFLCLKVARDHGRVCFYARTREPISEETTGEWMTLYLDTDGKRETGWEGYNLRVRPARSGGAMVERWSGRAWSRVATAPCVVQGNELMVAINRSTLGLVGKPVRVDFKWFDSRQPLAGIDDFTTNGDAAPNCRFNYRYAE